MDGQTAPAEGGCGLGSVCALHKQRALVVSSVKMSKIQIYFTLAKQ